MKRTAVIACVFALCAAGVAAEEGSSKLRFGLSWVSPTDDLSRTEPVLVELIPPGGQFVTLDIPAKLEAQPALGLEVNFEKGLNDRLGIEVAAGWTEHDVDFDLGGVTAMVQDPLGPPGQMVTVTVPAESGQFGKIVKIPVLVGLNVHLTPDSGVDFYVGPTVGYVFWGDLDLEPEVIDPGDPDSLGVDDEFVYGLNAGIDFGGDRPWGFHAGLRYLFVEAGESDGPEALGVDPLELRVGLTRTF